VRPKTGDITLAVSSAFTPNFLSVLTPSRSLAGRWPGPTNAAALGKVAHTDATRPAPHRSKAPRRPYPADATENFARDIVRASRHKPSPRGEPQALPFSYPVAIGHKKLSAWYHTLGQQLDAGLPFATALDASAGTGPPVRELRAMTQIVESGGSVDDALRAAGRWLPEADRLFLSAAAETGRLPRVLHNLSERHAQFGAVQLRMALACAYPLAVLQIGLLLFPLARMIDWERGFSWDPLAYGNALAKTVVPLWMLAAGAVYLARHRPAIFARLLRCLPVFRSYADAQALAGLSFALGNFLDAGLPIERAWRAAGIITPSVALRRAAHAIADGVARGEPPGAHLGRWRCFPPDFAALYRAGESAGQLERNLFHLTTQNQERANHALKAATLLYPALLFLGTVGLVGYLVVSFYAGYFNMLSTLGTR
jgi:type II secretory pathway component PulF